METIGTVLAFVFGLFVFIDAGLTLLGCGGRAEQGESKAREVLVLMVGILVMALVIL